MNINDVEHSPPICKIPILIVITRNGNTNIDTKHKIVQIN